MGKASFIDPVANRVAGKLQKLPFRWWTEVSELSDNKVRAVIRFHTGRGKNDEPPARTERGEVIFIFTKEDIMGVIPPYVWSNKLAIPGALGKVANERDRLNEELGVLNRQIADKALDSLEADARLIEAFSVSPRGAEISDDPFAWRLYYIAKLEACLALSKKVVGFDDKNHKTIPKY